LLPWLNSPLPTLVSVMVSATVSAPTVSMVERAPLVGQWVSGQVLTLKNHNVRQVCLFLLFLSLFSCAYSPRHLGRGGDDGSNWLDFLAAPPPNSINGVSSLPLHNPQHPYPHPHHPTSFLSQRNFSTGPVSGSGYPPSLSPSFGGLNQLNLSRLPGSEDSRSSRRPIPRDSTYSPWGSDASSSQSGRSDSSMSMFRPSQNMYSERDRRLEVEEVAPGAISSLRNLLP